VTLESYGFRIKGARVGELGPGDSIGTGLAALLSGADSYVGLDVLPLCSTTNLKPIFKELVRLYKEKAPIPAEFPRIRPHVGVYEFPDHLIDWTHFQERIDRIGTEISNGLSHRGEMIGYRAPWTSVEDVDANSLDLIISQAVLEYVVPLDDVYRAMSTWLKPGLYSSNVIDLSAHYLSPHWNGHWAYSQNEWWLARGRRESFLNREPLSAHLNRAQRFGFEILAVQKETSQNGLRVERLVQPYQALGIEDRETRGAYLILRKQ
jgi:hypothetical protein